jgi:hypothetical protein
MVKDETKCAETETVDNSATVLTRLNVSYSLDIRNARHMLLDLIRVFADSFLVKETLSNFGKGLGKFK